MQPIRRILVAVKDPGALTLPAVAKAARIAQACAAHVELFHALKTSIWANTPDAYDEVVRDLYQTERRQYVQRLERVAARLRLHGLKVTTAVEYDYPVYEAIVRRARLINADLIVTRRHSGRRGAAAFLRLTDWELLRHSPVPLLLVKRSAAYRRPNVLAAVDPCHAHSKPAQLDADILGLGAQLAAALQGNLHAVHAYAPVVIGSSAKSISASIEARLDRVAAADARKKFDQLLKGGTISRSRRHLVGDDPAKAIQDWARRIPADIVVMGALSRSGLKRLIIGNTAESLLDELPCDLLIVKPAAFVSRVPLECNGPRLLSKAG